MRQAKTLGQQRAGVEFIPSATRDLVPRATRNLRNPSPFSFENRITRQGRCFRVSEINWEKNRQRHRLPTQLCWNESKRLGASDGGRIERRIPARLLDMR